MFKLNFFIKNTMFYSPIYIFPTTNNCSYFVVGGGAVIFLSYKGLCHNFNINNMTTSSSFRYNYL